MSFIVCLELFIYFLFLYSIYLYWKNARRCVVLAYIIGKGNCSLKELDQVFDGTLFYRFKRKIMKDLVEHGYIEEIKYVKQDVNKSYISSDHEVYYKYKNTRDSLFHWIFI